MGKLIKEEVLLENWKDTLENEKFTPINEQKKKVFLAQMLENTRVFAEKNLKEGTVTGDVAGWEPRLISMVRRGTPNLIGADIFGTQPMTASTGSIYAIKSGYTNDTDNSLKPALATNSVVLVLADGSGFPAGTDISTDGAGAGIGVVRYQEDNTVLVGITSGSFAASDGVDDASTYSADVTTVSSVFSNEAQYQFLFKDYAKYASVALAESASTNMKEMGFTIDKSTVTAESYKLKAKWTDELDQDLQNEHNLSAQAELTRILSNEIAAEQNMTQISLLNQHAAVGGVTSWTYGTSGTPGRWEKENTFEMYSNINTVANQIAKTTMRGRGNFLVVSLDVASKLETLSEFQGIDVAKGIMDVDLGANAFIGTLGRKFKVYVDIFANANYVTIGYKGASEWDAGLYWCPYTPVTVKMGMGEEDGQPRMFFHTRAGLGENPFGPENYYRTINITL